MLYADANVIIWNPNGQAAQGSSLENANLMFTEKIEGWKKIKEKQVMTILFIFLFETIKKKLTLAEKSDKLFVKLYFA